MKANVYYYTNKQNNKQTKHMNMNVNNFSLGSKTCTEFINVNPHIKKKNKTDHHAWGKHLNNKLRIQNPR